MRSALDAVTISYRIVIKGGQILPAKNHDLHAIVALGPGLAGRICDRALRRWLSKGRLQYVEPTDEILHSVLQRIDHNAGDDGLAALRFWGQTGERSAAWMAAVEPVHLEARLDHLCLHALGVSQMPSADLRSIVDYLQATLGSEQYGFARIGQHVYLRGNHAMASARVSAQLVDGLRPDERMPKGGKGSAAESHHRLVSEVQMALHEHEVNINRQRSGLRAVNSIWIWGGGNAPQISVQPILPLFADDPLFKGFWFSRGGLVEPWTDSFDACVESADQGFVAITPEHRLDGEPAAPDHYLQQLQRLLQSKKLSRLSLLFRDGLRAEINAADAYRFWRRESSLLMPQ